MERSVSKSEVLNLIEDFEDGCISIFECIQRIKSKVELKNIDYKKEYIRVCSEVSTMLDVNKELSKPASPDSLLECWSKIMKVKHYKEEN